MSLGAYASLLDDVRRVRWPAMRRVSSAVPGAHTSRLRGTTAEFVEYRAYRPGDDLRKLDWKLLARSDRAYIRLSHERAILPTMVVLDGSASMAFPTGTLAKWELARRLAIALASVARNGADPVGMVVAHGDGTDSLPPRTRRSTIDEMIRLVSITPTGSPSIAAAASEAMRRSSRLVLITDFLGDADDLRTAVSHFVAAGKEAHAIHIVDSQELDPERRTLLFTDPEDSVLRRPMPAPVRQEYSRRFGEWRAELARAWRGAGVFFHMAVTGDEPVARIVRRVTTPVALPRS
jgi:uncharacterized protein (DUF58 family)